MGTVDLDEKEEPLVGIWIDGRHVRGEMAVLSHGMQDYWGSSAINESGDLHIEPHVWGTVLAAAEGRLPQSVWLMVLRPTEGMAVRQFEITNDPGQTIDLGNLSLQPLSQLDCRVLDSAGQPLAGVEVQWLMPCADPANALVPSGRSLRQIAQHSRRQQEQIPSPRWSSTVNADGHVRLSPLPVGSNRLLIGDQIVAVTLPMPPTAEIVVPGGPLFADPGNSLLTPR
jgi:hypothetical protein